MICTIKKGKTDNIWAGVKRETFLLNYDHNKRSHAVAIKSRVKKGKRLLFYNALKGLSPCNKIINVKVNLKQKSGRVTITVVKKYLGKQELTELNNNTLIANLIIKNQKTMFTVLAFINDRNEGKMKQLPLYIQMLNYMYIHILHQYMGYLIKMYSKSIAVPDFGF